MIETHRTTTETMDYPAWLSRLGVVRHAVFMAADLAALVAAFVVAALLSLAVSEGFLGRPYRDFFADDTTARVIQFGGLGLCLLLVLQAKGHYRQRLPLWSEIKHIVIGCSLMLLADGFLMFALKADFSRLWLVQTWILAAIFIPAARRPAVALLDRYGCWRLPVLVIGSGEDAEDASFALRSERSLGYDIVGVEPLSSVERDLAGSTWTALCERRGAQLVILALSDTDFVGRGEIIADLVRERLPFAVVPPLRGLPVLGFDRLYFFSHDVMIMVAHNNLAQPLSRAVKLAFDVVMAGLLTALLLPVFAVFALLIMRDGGPVVYGHTRIGRAGRPFTCLKFRTMVPDADRELHALLAEDPATAAEWEATFKLKNDPRVTGIGRFLRASSLDELLQLLNVLRGDMSLVGPRPVTAEELEYYGRDVSFYLETRPGMTGLWQISGRSATSYSQRIRLDVWYVKNWSLWHDIAILVKTAPVVLRRIGAF